MKRFLFLVMLISLFRAAPANALEIKYPWLEKYELSSSIAANIPPPEGFKRISAASGSFAEWLRELPLKPAGEPVRLFNKKLKNNQQAHFRVIDIDAGSADLQQCADAVMRLRAEYLYSLKKFDAISFDLTGGPAFGFKKWSEGFRIKEEKGKIKWVGSGSAGTGYANFRKYLTSLFIYAGTYSLSKELKTVSEPVNMNIGDVFIKGGFPGHAVIVVDMAEDKASGKKLFLIAQSYMPAQDIHILKNPADQALSPWYDAAIKDRLETPEWVFEKGQLKSF